MNETESHVDPASDQTVAALREELKALRTMIAGTVAVLVLLSFSLNVFFLVQDTLMRNQVAQAQLNLAQFNANFTPNFHELWNRLQTFGRTHPDLKPILDHYGPHIEFKNSAGAQIK
jgi:hypothetical protein